MRQKFVYLFIGLLGLLGTSLSAQIGQSNACADNASITLVGSNTSPISCTNDGNPDVYSFRTNVAGQPFGFLVTDENNVILEISLSNQIDLDPYGPGLIRVWGFYFLGQLVGEVGQDADEAQLGSVCSHLTTNFIEFLNIIPDGGTVSTIDGASSQFVCVGDNNLDEIAFATTSTSPAYAYVVTYEDNAIVGIIDGNNTFQFNNLPTGTCRVYGVAYGGDILADLGDDITTVDFSSSCFDLSDNFVEIVKTVPDGGTVSLENGDNEIIICTSDNAPDVLSFNFDSDSPAPYIFLIVDEAGNILQVLDNNSAEFESLPGGFALVYGVSYTGEFTANVGDNIEDVAFSDDCFDLSSNFVTVLSNDVDGGAVSLEDGTTETFACVNDGIADVFTVVNTSTANEAYTYLVTDDNNIILDITDDGTIDFEGADPGICRVWGLSYSGALLAQAGDDAAVVNLSTECFDLSSNFVTVARKDVEGGEIALEDGSLEISICTGDGTADELVFNTTSTSTETYVYVVTDENNIILAVNQGSTVDFDGAGPGVCRVWGLSYSGSLTADAGDDAAAVALSDECFELSSNFVTVIRSEVDGGEVTLDSGETMIDICLNDGIADTLNFVNSSTSDEAYLYVVTDENNIILATSETGEIDFENATQGVCRVWGLSYSGNLLAQAGDDAAAVDLSDFCFELSSNFVTVNRQEVDGGVVSTIDDEIVIYACLNDDESDEYTFQTTSDLSNGANYVYVITDQVNNIIDISEDGVIDFEDAPIGICLVWGLSYTGNIIAEPGDNATEVALTDDCYALSENFVFVVRDEVDGGGVSIASTGGSNATVCVNDGVVDTLVFDRFTTSGANYIFLLTDADNNLINISGGVEDFDSFTPGEYRIWGLSFTGDLIAPLGSDITNSDLTNGCFEISNNFVTILAKEVDGGDVELTDGTTFRTICLGDAIADTISVNNNSTSTENYVYVVTDDQNQLLNISEDEIVDLPSGDEGICRVWGLSYSGNITAQIGDDLAVVEISDECYELSNNFIEIVKVLVDGGEVSLEGGATSSFACVNDGTPDVFVVENNSVSNANYVYVITDDQNTVLALSMSNEIDLEAAPAGICRIWGLSYTGNITAEVGDNAADVALSDDCFVLSDNFIEIVRDEVDGGTVAMPSGETTRFVCPGDTNPDVVQFDSTGTTSASYIYVITDLDNVILDVATGDSFDFNDSPIGICRVWGLAYSGDIIANIGDDADEVALSDQCFDLSDNFITVIREIPEGGTVETEDGEDLVYTCPGDGNADIIAMDSMATSSNAYVYVVTDAENNILDLVTMGDEIDFEGAPAGECRVWGLAYTGNITAQIGDNAAEVPLSDDCFDLSANFVTVIREVPEAGTVLLENGEDLVYVCPGDTMADIISYDSIGASINPFIYVLTTDSNIILGFFEVDELDFNTVPEGICRIWGLSYTGNITAQVGDNAAEVALTDDCFDLSDNFITLIRETPDGGDISLLGGGNEATACQGDGEADLIEFEVNNASNSPYTYAITDENGFLIGLINNDSFDFEDAQAGVYRIYGIAYTGNILIVPGDNIFEFPVSSDCWAVTDTFIQVTGIEIDGGEVLGDGEEVVYVCPNDNVDDIITFTNNSSATGASYGYLLTTPSNSIVGILNGNQQNFDNTGFTELRVWGVSYTGNATFSIGANAATSALSDECFTLSDNFVTIFRDQPEESSISTAEGETDVFFCIENGDYDLEMENTSGSFAGYVYLLTDENNIIISVHEDAVNFEGVDQGVYQITGLNYTGTLLAAAGLEVGVDALATSCNFLSDNTVTVELGDEVDGGIVSTQSGLDTIYVCPMDGVPDLVVLNTTSADTNYVYVVTDNNGSIIVPNVIGNVINFDAAAPGTCRIYGVSFTGSFNAMFGEDVGIDDLSTECSAISENYITLIRVATEGGTVSTVDGATEVEVTVNDGVSDELTFVNADASNADYAYVVTDENNVILALVDGDTQDFEDAPEGVCRVWGLSYSGDIIAQVGDNAAEVDLTDGCFDLSDNFVTVTRVDGGAGGELNVIESNVASSTSMDVELSVAPNPGINNIQVSFEITENMNSEASLQIISIDGQVLESQQVMIQKGSNQFELDITEVPAGMNYIRLVSDQILETTNFIKVRD